MPSSLVLNKMNNDQYQAIYTEIQWSTTSKWIKKITLKDKRFKKLDKYGLPMFIIWVLTNRFHLL